MKTIQGVAHVCGDNIDTDRIIPAKYIKTLDVQQLANHVLEDLDPDLRHRIKLGDILVAGQNFGCGSSREQAPLALRSAGISAVVARSFARIFYRNAINVGLPAVTVQSHTIRDGSSLRIDLGHGEVEDKSNDCLYPAVPMPGFMNDILDAGGLVSFLRIRGGRW